MTAVVVARRAMAAVVVVVAAVAAAALIALAGEVRPSVVAVVGGPPTWLLKNIVRNHLRPNPMRQRIWTSTLRLILIRVQLAAPPTAGRSRSSRSAPQAGSPTPSTAPAPDETTAKPTVADTSD